MLDKFKKILKSFDCPACSGSEEACAGRQQTAGSLNVGTEVMKNLQKAIGYVFKNPKNLELSLIHKSYSSECGLNDCNERMEFLGDGILSALVSEHLYNKYSDKQEGDLSQLKAQIVSAKNLSRWAKEIKLDQFVLVSKNEELNGARQRESLLCDSFEAVAGAVYLDGGFEAASKFINAFLEKQSSFDITDYKTKLQEKIQSLYRTLPQYKTIEESGPDHNKQFKVAVFVKEKQLGAGSGNSKKQAEQMAAREALKEIKN